MTQDTKKDTILHTGKGTKFCSVRFAARLLLLLLMMTAGASMAWAQDYSGTYFIANGNGYSSTNIANNFYLVPATNSSYATDQPHLTTSKTGQVLNCCWQIVKSGDYYRIIHVADGKYLTANPAYSGTKDNDVGRLRVHLEEMATPDDNTLFEIKANSNGGYNIRHKDMADKINNSTTTYLDPAGGNIDGTNLTNKRTASTSSGTINVGGGIGYWTDEAAARWRFEDVPQTNTYTYNIVDRSGRIAIKYTTGADQPAAKALSSYTDIPTAIRSPYLNGETVSFYSFSGDFSTDKLSAENKITATPVTDGANIYVTYTTDHLGEKFVKLRGASAFNITVNNKCIYDNSGLNAEATDFSSTTTTTNHLWYFTGNDPYAVQIKNLDTDNLLQFDTTVPALSVATAPTNKYFIVMDGSTSGAGIANGQMELMAATGDVTYYRIKNDGSLNIDNSTATGDASLQVRAYPVSITTKYHLIDKAGKLIEGNIESESSELGLPDEWKSPLVSEYHYYRTPNLSGDTYAPTGTVSSPFDVGSGGDIYVTYDVGNEIDITGGKNYMLKFLDGDTFNQEDGSDGILSTATQAVYPYNNGDFNLYVYGQAQWDKQLGDGASTRTRWLWKIVSSNVDNADPYHVIIKSNQNQSIKYNSVNYAGTAFLRTYKPEGYASVVTGTTYENTGGYKDALPTADQEGCLPTDEPTEYMILGTSISSMTLKTVNPVDGSRRIVDSFEQYWKNNPTVEGLVGANPDADNTTLRGMDWHRYQQWAYSAPWGGGSKTYAQGDHWFQTIKMGTGENAGKFTVEPVDLAPQVILIDQHGWEIMRIPLSDTETLRKYDSPMVEKYQWYPTALKTEGYHKYRVSDSKIKIYKYAQKPNSTSYDWIESGTYYEVPELDENDENKYLYTSTTLADSPYGHITTPACEKPNCTDPSHSSQPDKVKTDFYVTYTVKDAYASNYQGAATEEAVVPSSYLVKQGGNYATYSGSGTAIGTVATKPSRENVTDEIRWNLKTNFNIDREMGYKYAGETGATGDAQSKTATEANYYDNGQNGFDPYNVQIQNKAYPLRYFTTNATASVLNGGAWAGTTSTAVTLQNLSTKYTATGYDQTTLNITNATFMVVSDGNGNMRLMPRFDNSKVMTSFGTLAAQAAAASAGDQGTGTQTLYLELVADAKEIHSSTEITDPNGNYLLASDFSFASDFTSLGTSSAPFTGTIDGQMNTFEGLKVPLVAYANGAIIKNIMLKDVAISQSGNVGAICCNANGATRIYNCGILPSTVDHDPNPTKRSTVTSTNGHCGSLVGNLDGYARVINCFSYANVSAGSSKNAGGLVGNNTTDTMQGNSPDNFNNNVKTMVVNCMFYGDITAGSTKCPVYGGTAIVNNAADKVNNYNYYCEEEASFDDDYTDISNYNYSWPIAKKHLTRFEVYRNILNTNRRLCTWWVSGLYDTCPTDADVESVGIAKWVLDRTIAPYPILKKWGKYYSTFDMDPDYVWNPKTMSKVARSTANPWEGKSYGTLSVTINGGTGNSLASASRDITITDMDTLDCDYCYYKIQLPYYNEVFGDPESDTWATKYANNYTSKVVTGWKVTSVTGGTQGSFEEDWEDGYNFADRKCTDKDKFEVSGRVFAQGGYYYVPDNVTAITIEAYWGNAVYLCNSNRCLDKMNNGTSEFYVSGKLPEKVGGITDNPTVQTSLKSAVGALKKISDAQSPGNTVYDQAIVLVGNFQDNSCHSDLLLNGNNYNSDAKPFTIMSADFDFDNEPDFCFQAGMNGASRPNFQPIRFDFLMVPDITMAIRTVDLKYYGIRNICPQGHYEVTETSYMYVTQFEYEIRNDNAKYYKHEAPMILNGGEFTQIVSTHKFDQANENATATKRADRTSYFLMGGKLYMKAFTPGTHVNTRSATRHCAVNAIGGDFPEFYLSGMFRADFYNMTDNPHAYLDGGWFDMVAGAGMESVGAKNETNGGNVTFKINHSRIHEFYGGGINATRPVTGTIDVTIDNSIVHKYCGGPKLGDMSSAKSITTTATGTTFDQFFGGGNGGTNMLRENKFDGWQVAAPTKTDHSVWDDNTANSNKKGGKFGAFTPFKYEEGKGYQAEFEFELLPIPAGDNTTVPRTYYHYASFSKTMVAPITTTITDCTFNDNFYGGGNLGAVGGDVTSILQGHTVVKGSVFGAGFSASIPSFPVHDKSSVVYTYRDFAGFIHDGGLDYKKYEIATGTHAAGDTIYYQWIHDVPTEWNISNLGTGDGKTKTFQYPADSGNWYVYTPTDLTGLGTVSGNVTLTIKGTTEIGTLKGGVLKAGTGNVFGGGAQSAVTGNTTVKLLENANILGNVYGGGDQGEVSGSATVNIMVPETNNNGGNNGGS